MNVVGRPGAIGPSLGAHPSPKKGQPMTDARVRICVRICARVYERTNARIEERIRERTTHD